MKYLSIQETAKQLGMSRMSINQWAYQGLLPVIKKDNGRWLIEKECIDDLVVPPDKLMTLSAVAKIFRVNLLTIRNWIESGLMSHVVIPSGMYRVRRSEMNKTSSYRRTTPYNKHKAIRWKWKLIAVTDEEIYVDKDDYFRFRNENIIIRKDIRAEYPYIAGKDYLHRLILEPKVGIVDFIDKDTFDLRRRNIRITTNSISNFNRRAYSKLVKYKGVQRNYNKWIALCNKTYIGTFDTENAAARAYDEHVKKVLKPKDVIGRVLNFV